jgi:hypothetical protein
MGIGEKGMGTRKYKGKLRERKDCGREVSVAKCKYYDSL